MLNPNLDRAAFAEQFAVDGRVRIENILDADVAERIRECCLDHVPYEYLTNIDGQNVVITADEMTNFSEEMLCFIAEVGCCSTMTTMARRGIPGRRCSTQ